MNRFPPHILGLAVGVALSVSASADVVPETIEGARPRNVVFILSDDYRHDAMSFISYPFAKCPTKEQSDDAPAKG